MFRAVLRNKQLKELVKKAVRLNSVRSLNVECTRSRPNSNQPLLLRHRNTNYWKYNAVRFYALPPHKKVMLPALSPTGDTANIVSWEKKEGDKLNEGDVLAEIETDKATMSFETPEVGYLAKIIVPGGTKNVLLGTLVCIIVQNQADIAAFKDYKDDGAAPKAAAAAPAASIPLPAPAVAASVPAPAAAVPASTPAPNVPHKIIMLPALSPTGDTANIASWEKKEGDSVKEGDVLAEIETDKATMSFETPEEGFLAKILIPAGTKNVLIGKELCVIVKNQGDVAAFKNWSGSGGAAAAPASASAPAPAQQAAQPSGGSGGAPGGRVYASPLAKKIAKEKGITLQGKGTGFFDSITSRDLPAMAAGAAPAAAAAASGAGARVPSFTPRAAAAQKAAAAPAGKAPAGKAPAGKAPAPGASFIDTPVTSMRATIAKRLLQSKQSIPHYYITVEVIMDKLMAERARFNKAMEKKKIKLSVNDFVIKAVAMAAKTVPDVNSMWMDTVIRQFNHVDVSVAVSTDKGLITPIVFNADSKGLIQISKDMKDLAAKARANKLKPQEFQGGTICISNLGMFGVDTFCAVINPPQACILAVGASSKKLVLDSKSEKGFKEITKMNVTLSADHRVVDGAVGSTWLEVLRKNLEDPVHMIL